MRDGDGKASKPVRRGLSRRVWLRLALYGAPALAAASSVALEPRWLRRRTIHLPGGPGPRVAHFTDTHFKGDRALLQHAIDAVNEVRPDLVCFTGDIVEDRAFLDEALALFSGIKAPLFGVPGNHEYWSGVPFEPIARCFADTGGAWLVDEVATWEGITLVGRARRRPDWQRDGSGPVLALTHYPLTAEDFLPGETDLILAGHSHGGQVRLPFYGAPILPGQVGPYDLGLFEREGWRLYVNPGIGTWQYPVRFLCRPEVTLFTW